jgi:hypothetical protein
VDAGPGAPAEKPATAVVPLPADGAAADGANAPATANGSMHKRSGAARSAACDAPRAAAAVLDAGAAPFADAPAKAESQPDEAGAQPPAPDGGADAALAAVQREMAAAKEAAAAEIALMRRQLASAQAAASEAEKVRAAPPWSRFV